MARCTIYGAQPFRRDWSGFHPLEPALFRSAENAELAGQRLAHRYEGVLVFLQRGDPEWDVWDEAEILAQHGFVPEAFTLAAA